MGIKMPEWEWKASKKGKGKGKGKGKKSSLQEPSISKPPTSTDLKTTQGTINIFKFMFMITCTVVHCLLFIEY